MYIPALPSLLHAPAPPPLQQVRQSVGFCCNCLIKKIEVSNEKNVVGAYAAPAALQLRSSLVRILLPCLRSLCLYLRQPLLLQLLPPSLHPVTHSHRR